MILNFNFYIKNLRNLKKLIKKYSFILKLKNAIKTNFFKN